MPMVRINLEMGAQINDRFNSCRRLQGSWTDIQTHEICVGRLNNLYFFANESRTPMVAGSVNRLCGQPSAFSGRWRFR